jgi:hypothetical protein
VRIWTFHPKYLDAAGLVALWREGLLAQKVLLGKTKGYKNHPQLIRFRQQPEALASISTYLQAVYDESMKRGYCFDASKINPRRTEIKIAETKGQLVFEWQHFLNKLKDRQPKLYQKYIICGEPESHPAFRIIPGEVREWERIPTGKDSSE